MDFEGLTGRIHFGKYGERSDFTLDITKLDKTGLKKVPFSRILDESMT